MPALSSHCLPSQRLYKVWVLRQAPGGNAHAQCRSVPWVVQAFFADIYAEAKRAKPSLGHKALAGLAAQGKLQRHYTLNIDGLAQAVGLSTWHPDRNPTGMLASTIQRADFQGCRTKGGSRA